MSEGVWLPQEEFDALVEKVRQHEVSLDAAMQRATRRVEQAEEAERDAVRAAVEWGDRVKQAERERDELGPLFIRDCCRILGVDENDMLRMDKIAARLAKQTEALREIRDREPDRSSVDQQAFFWTWAKQVASAALSDEEQG